MTRASAPSHTAVEPVASSVLGDENDLNSVAHALDIGGIGTPYRAYQGSLYCDYQTYRIADFQDYGLALAATVLFNNAKAIKTALSTITAQAAALVAAESNAERMERNWRTAAALVERHEATIEVQSNKLTVAESEVATLKARVAELEAGLGDVFRLNDECSGSEPSISVLMRAIDDLRARRLTHQEKNNGR